MDEHVSKKLNDKVMVSGIPANVSRDDLMIHFQRKENHGGDIRSLVYPISKQQHDKAIVQFEQESVAGEVLKKSHHISRKMKKNIPVEVAEYEHKIFDSVTVTANKESLDEITSSENLDDIIEESGVEIVQDKREIKFEGELYKIRKLDEMLKGRDEEEDTTDHNSQTPERNGTSEDENLENTIELDNDIYNYMKIGDERGEVQSILNEHVINTRVAEDKVFLTFRPDPAEKGINKMQKLYSKAQENMKQMDYKLPLYVARDRVQSYIEQAQEIHQNVIISISPTRNTIFFFGGSLPVCSQAKETFMSLVGDNPGAWNQRKHYPVVQTQPMPEFEKLFEFDFPKSGLHIAVVKGDIAKQKVDAIVNAANNKLHDGAGVTGAIFRAGTYEFNIGCQNLMASRNFQELEIGEVVHTDACGYLKCKHVLHVVGPIWRDLPAKGRGKICSKIMNDLCWRLIQYANNTTNSTSIGIPAISTGIYGVPKSYFCNAMLQSIEEFQKVLEKGHYTTSLREIRIVSFIRDEGNIIADYFKQKLKREQESEV